jgi:hypothetical protein
LANHHDPMKLITKARLRDATKPLRGELSEEVKPVRDAAGQIDIQGTMQAARRHRGDRSRALF